MKVTKLNYKYFGIIILIIVLFYFLLEYRIYHEKKLSLQDSGFGISLMNSFNNYLLENEEPSIDAFLNYLEAKSNSDYKGLLEREWNLGIKVLDNDTIILYEYGFDNKDDKNPQEVNLEEYNFVNYLFDNSKDFQIFEVELGGNTNLFKDDMEIELEEDIKNFKAFSDSLDLIEKKVN
ncbi:MAG: hypothetical protein OQJ94_06595 [Flavobacteriales bacterium]|nr:hypothetical protein [Flavobacteriales bacterium]